MGILNKERKIGISVGMNEYQRMCVFMVHAKEKEKKKKRKRKEKDGENKSTGNKSNWTPLSSSPKKKIKENYCMYQHTKSATF